MLLLCARSHLDPVKVGSWHRKGDALLEKLDAMISKTHERNDTGDSEVTSAAAVRTGLPLAADE